MNISDSEYVNPEYIGEPGQMRRFMIKSQYDPMMIQHLPNENIILESMYSRIMKDLINKGMFTLNRMENMDGSILFEISLDVRTPPNYGTPGWESLKKY